VTRSGGQNRAESGSPDPTASAHRRPVPRRRPDASGDGNVDTTPEADETEFGVGSDDSADPLGPGGRTTIIRPGDHPTELRVGLNEEETVPLAPRQRRDSAVRIVNMIGADSPARIIARPPAQSYRHTRVNRQRRIGRPVLADVAVCLGFALFALLLVHGLWQDPGGRALLLGSDDQTQAEWFLSYAAHVYSGDFSLVTDRLNAPAGVNLLSNASLVLLGVVLGPVTLAFGAPVSFVVATALNLAATASGWYLLFARALDRHRAAAVIAAAFAGFSPGLVSQSNGHLHVTGQWLVPALAWCVLRLTRAPDRRQLVLTGVLLGLLVTVQYHLGAEVLYLTAVGFTLFGTAYAFADRRQLRRALPALGQGLGLAGGVAAILLAYPLWVQFGGPQHVRGGPFPSYHFSLDAAALPGISPLSLAGAPGATRYASDPGEYNAFFGLPLLVVIVGVTIWLRRRPVIVAAAAAAVGALLLAMGPKIVVDGEPTGIPGPYALFDDLPVTSAALPGRLALIAAPLFALLLCVAIDASLHLRVRRSQAWLPLVVPLAVIGALAPIAPLPLPTMARPPVPRYFTEGNWRGCGNNGGVIVPVPLPEPRRPETMRWATAANTGFALPGGFFIGPYGAHGQASVGTFPRPTAQLLARIADTGEVPAITDQEKARARADVAYWGARCVVLADQPNRQALHTTLDQLFGPGQRVVDVDVWRVG
jgi:hypothetical protein